MMRDSPAGDPPGAGLDGTAWPGNRTGGRPEPPSQRSDESAVARLWALGPEALDDVELVAALLGGSGKGRAAGVAGALLQRVGGLSSLAQVGPARLAQVAGVGRARAARLVACAELARRLRVRAARLRPTLVNPRRVAEILAPRVDRPDVEQLWVLSLDGRNGLRGMRCVARGGSHGCAVTAREILRCALADAASAFVMAHNHPSGDPTPSAEDVTMTRAVAQAALVVGIPLVDHVIVTHRGSYASLLDRGLI